VKVWGSIVGPFLPAPDRTPKGGDSMVLTLYHDDKEPFKVYNVIKVDLDDLKTITVTIKHGGNIEHLPFRYLEDYQRFTVQLD